MTHTRKLIHITSKEKIYKTTIGLISVIIYKVVVQGWLPFLLPAIFFPAPQLEPQKVGVLSLAEQPISEGAKSTIVLLFLVAVAFH